MQRRQLPVSLVYGVGGVQKDVRVTRSLSSPTGAPRRTQTPGAKTGSACRSRRFYSHIRTCPGAMNESRYHVFPASLLLLGLSVIVYARLSWWLLWWLAPWEYQAAICCKVHEAS